MTPAATAFLQQLGATLGFVAGLIAVIRRREILNFFGSHAAKSAQIMRLEGENAQLRNSLAASILASEGFEKRIIELSDRVEAFDKAQSAMAESVKTLTAKFTAGIAYIASRMDHGDTSGLPALIRDDVEVEIRRQRRATPSSPSC
jgi:hypothetical protein